MKTFLNIILAVLLVSCGGAEQKEDHENQKEMEKKEINYLVFEFHDSSVPPPYHRSYSLEFKDDRVKIVVDSYGDILTDTLVVLGEDKVDKALGYVNQFGVKSKIKNEEDEGCTGGTGISVSYGFDDETHCSGYVYFCAGEQFGDLSGELEELKYALKELIPNFSQYLKED